MIDDAAHTIESVGGNASILLEHPGIPAIKLWDGPLKADLGKNDNVGDPLFSMPMTTFHADVLGFEALGTPVAVLGAESVADPAVAEDAELPRGDRLGDARRRTWPKASSVPPSTSRSPMSS